MPTVREQIEALALQILGKHPEGLRYTELRDLVAAQGSFNSNTVGGTIWDLEIRAPDKVLKPSRGVYRLAEFGEAASGELKAEAEPPPLALKTKESDFYAPFAEWLMYEREECTKAIALGGAKFGVKWGTPDVIGKRESMKSDIIQAPLEIVSAEVKTDTQQLVTAFGQACSYLLFSHKSYLVVPVSSPKDELDRMRDLAEVFGIGLVVFDTTAPKNPAFDLYVSARKHEPNLAHTNKYLKLIEKELF